MRYLKLNEIVKINRRMIFMYNEKEQVGVKSQELLESAVYRPQQSLFGKDAYVSVFEKGASLFESLGKNHPFHNANKRTALASLIIFLHLNGYLFVMEQKEAEDFTVDMVNGMYSFSELTRIIERHCYKI